MENSRSIPSNSSGYPWKLFWLLLGAGFFSFASAVPYALALLGDKLPKLPLPLPAIVALQSIQAVLLLAVSVGVGLPLLRRRRVTCNRTNLREKLKRSPRRSSARFHDHAHPVRLNHGDRRLGSDKFAFGHDVDDMMGEAGLATGSEGR